MTIAEVSRAYGISADTLRYYERIGLIPPVPRTKGGVRNYGEESCGWIQLMKCMRAAGVQIEALIEYVDLFRQGDATIGARKALLMEQRDQLVARMEGMQASLDLLNQKELDDVYASARFCADSIVGQMAACRRISDTLETMVDKTCWPVPTYSDILFY